MRPILKCTSTGRRTGDFGTSYELPKKQDLTRPPWSFYYPEVGTSTWSRVGYCWTESDTVGYLWDTRRILPSPLCGPGVWGSRFSTVVRDSSLGTLLLVSVTMETERGPLRYQCPHVGCGLGWSPTFSFPRPTPDPLHPSIPSRQVENVHRYLERGPPSLDRDPVGERHETL